MLALILPFSHNIERYLLISRAFLTLLPRLSWVTKEPKLCKHPVNKTNFFVQLLHLHFNDLQHMSTNVVIYNKSPGKTKKKTKNKTVTWRSKQFHKSPEEVADFTYILKHGWTGLNSAEIRQICIPRCNAYRSDIVAIYSAQCLLWVTLTKKLLRYMD